MRDRAFIQWRYFSGDADKHVFAFKYPGESDRLVVINEVNSGYRGQIRVLNLLDIWPPASPLSGPALAAHVHSIFPDFHIMWMRSQPPETEAAMKNFGFLRHAFPAPLGWWIDKENHLSSHDWYSMPGESE